MEQLERLEQHMGTAPMFFKGKDGTVGTASLSANKTVIRERSGTVGTADNGFKKGEVPFQLFRKSGFFTKGGVYLGAVPTVPAVPPGSVLRTSYLLLVGFGLILRKVGKTVPTVPRV